MAAVVQEKVVGLDVAVEHALLLEEAEHEDELRRQAPRLRRGQACAFRLHECAQRAVVIIFLQWRMGGGLWGGGMDAYRGQEKVLAVVERGVQLDEPGDAREALEGVLLLERADVARGPKLGDVDTLQCVAEPGRLVPDECHDALGAAA